MAGLLLGGGGGGGYMRNKSFEMRHSSVDPKTIFLCLKVLIKQHLALFSTVIQQRGAYNWMY